MASTSSKSVTSSLDGIRLEDDDALKGYTRNRRELLEILNGLRDCGMDKYLDLPQIVVIGSQSAGKSSLIESMSGISLPRDASTCTRCPMECRLLCGPDWSCKITLWYDYDDVNREPLKEIRTFDFGPTLFNKSEVERTIRRAQRAILHPSVEPERFVNNDDPVDPNIIPLSFSANRILIRITGPAVPDLSFFDLPGIIANVRDGDDVRDIGAVENIAKTYIARPNSLILLVVSCETDFENQGAGRLVLKDPSLRSRTIGVLTKADRIEAGAEAKWISMLKNTENSLEKGWFAVKQPSPREHLDRISWERARASEDEFFTSTEPWKSLEQEYRRRTGSVHLSENLSIVLSDLMARRLPEIRQDIDRILRDSVQELGILPTYDHPDPRREIITLIRDFVKVVSKNIDGLPPTPEEVESCVPFAGLIYQVNEICDSFRRDVHRTAPRFRPWSREYHIKASAAEGGEETRLYEAHECLSETACYSCMLRSAAEDDTEDGNGYYMYADQVSDLAKRSRTRELPGNVPFAVKENLIKNSTKEWKQLAKKCFEDVNTAVAQQLNHILEEHFRAHTYGGLLTDVSDVLRTILLEREQVTNTSLSAISINEQLPYTQNEDYFFAFRTKLLNRYRILLRETRGQLGLMHSLQNFDPQEPDHATRCQDFWADVNTILSKLASRGIRGVVASDLAKLLPHDDMDQALEIMAEVRAYFQVSFKRFGDVIPQQIDADFLREIPSSLNLALMSMDLSAEQCAKWLEEPPEVAQKRGELLAKKQRLESGKEKLASYKHRA